MSTLAANVGATRLVESSNGRLSTVLGHRSMARVLLERLNTFGYLQPGATMLDPVERFKVKIRIFDGQPPWEASSLRRASSIPANTTVDLFILCCRPPQHQHIALEDSAGPTARFVRELAALTPDRLTLFHDIFPCTATSVRPKCADVPSDLRIPARREMTDSLTTLNRIVQDRQATIGRILVFGRVANQHLSLAALRGIFGVDVEVTKDILHPGGLRHLGSNDKAAGWMTLLLALGLARNNSFPAVYSVWDKVRKLSLLARFQLDLSSLWKKVNAKSESEDEKDGLPDANFFRSVSDDIEYTGWCEVEKPSEQLVAKSLVYRIEWRFHQREDDARQAHPGKVLGVLKYSAAQWHTWRTATSTYDLYRVLRGLYTRAQDGITASYLGAGGGKIPDLPVIPATEMDLWAFLDGKRPQYRTSNGPVWHARCTNCQADRLSSEWLLGFPLIQPHSAEDCQGPSKSGKYEPIDPVLRAVAVTSGTIQANVNLLRRYKESVDSIRSAETAAAAA